MSDIKEFNITGTITIQIDVDVEGVNEAAVEAELKESLQEYHRLDIKGTSIDDYDIELDTIEWE